MLFKVIIMLALEDNCLWTRCIFSNMIPEESSFEISGLNVIFFQIKIDIMCVWLERLTNPQLEIRDSEKTCRMNRLVSSISNSISVSVTKDHVDQQHPCFVEYTVNHSLINSNNNTKRTSITRMRQGSQEQEKQAGVKTTFNMKILRLQTSWLIFHHKLIMISHCLEQVSLYLSRRSKGCSFIPKCVCDSTASTT
jgi:hypothetical protein